MARLRICALRVSGVGKEDAAVDFGSGMTFITGLSNTGKSHILECIDYALAAGSAPREIPEAVGYDRVTLELEADGAAYTISRLLGGEEAIVFDGPLEDWDGMDGEAIKVKISSKDPRSTLSGRLLEMSGFKPDTPIIRNQRGQTQTLSFRNVVHFALVGEEEIIKTDSPILPGQSVQDTAAKSTFRVLLTGKAPSNEEIDALQKAHDAREQAKQEGSVLERLIEELRDEIAEEATDRQELERELARIDLELAEVSETVSESGEKVRSLMADRNEALDDAEEARQVVARSKELADRFALLGKHYVADVQRLEFVLEGGHFFNQLDASHCPHCGQPLEPGTECHPESANFEQIERASRAEIKKLAPRMADLEMAVAEAKSEAEAAGARLRKSAARAQGLDAEIREVASPTAASARKRVEKISSRRRELERQLLPHRQLARYVEARQEASLAADKKIKRYHPDYDHESVMGLTTEIKSLLEAWKFPFSDLYFSSDTDDLVIDGKPRGANGKGVRAVTHAAFTIGLMRHCLTAETPHPGFVVIDTPLRHFKGLEDSVDDPTLTRDLHAACLYSVAISKNGGQAIIIDNDDPPAAIRGLATIHEFSGAEGDGRRGFYPPR